MSEKYREAYIRVAVVSEADGFARCLPVDADGLAFDGVAFFPGHLKVSDRAIVPATLARDIEPTQIMYNGKPLNRMPKPRKARK